MSAACKGEASNVSHRVDTEAVSTVGATVEDASERTVPDEVEAAVDVRGTTLVTYTSGGTAEYEWSCFAQRVDGDDYASIQSFDAK